ncbi:MAG: septal ring lytic transglycosylase RlpA family protein [Candidatus Omnitrophica bacterium]|nr:septal ring lytic transglycosylase RlpA family protein [Candidatus Omnitrophota bacterium]
MRRSQFISHARILAITILIIAVSSLAPSGSNSEASFTDLEGIASWYAEFSPGIKETTANMEIFDHDKMTCAMWGVPFDSLVEVVNIENGQMVTVRVNDRGPAKRLSKKGRIIDLTKAAFEEIEDLDKGLAKVRVKVLN